jgi:protein-disulfide isomerase
MREGGFRKVGGLAQRLTSNIAKGRDKSRGASIARLRADWPAIVGVDIARSTEPEALMAGRGGHGGGKLLRLRVSGAAALEIQHMSRLLIERVNAYFGHRQIDDIRLVQGVFSRLPAPVQRRLAEPSPEVAARLDGEVAKVDDPDLRAALARLGARVATNTKRRTVLAGVLGALFAAREPRAQGEGAVKYLAALPGDHILGKPNAPNIIIDYFSLTCPHCANFNAAVLPQVKREWIENGSTKLIMRHFPSDSIATHASLLAECAGPEKFYDSLDVLFRAQVDWLTAADPEAEMAKAIGKLGIEPGAAQACLADDHLLDKVIADVQSGQALKVNSTPSLFINEQFYGMPADGAAGITSILRQVSR